MLTFFPQPAGRRLGHCWRPHRADARLALHACQRRS
jgi:hypothetical protein